MFLCCADDDPSLSLCPCCDQMCFPVVHVINFPVTQSIMEHKRKEKNIRRNKDLLLTNSNISTLEAFQDGSLFDPKIWLFIT